MGGTAGVWAGALIKMIQALLRYDKLIFYLSNEIYINSNKNQNSLTRTT